MALTRLAKCFPTLATALIEKEDFKNRQINKNNSKKCSKILKQFSLRPQPQDTLSIPVEDAQMCTPIHTQLLLGVFRGLVSELLEDIQIHRLSSPLFKMAQYMHSTCAQHSIHFTSSLDYF
jgi:hypothetical protein